jgi:uncharacterized membrane protein YidH (DUF202 family)
MTSSQEPTGRGLARERTILAWYRSGLAALVCVAVLLRNTWPVRTDGQVLALGLIGAAAIVWAIVLFTFAISGRDREAEAPARRGALGLVTAGTLLLAAVAFVVSLVSAP